MFGAMLVVFVCPNEFGGCDRLADVSAPGSSVAVWSVLAVLMWPGDTQSARFGFAAARPVFSSTP